MTTQISTLESTLTTMREPLTHQGRTLGAEIDTLLEGDNTSKEHITHADRVFVLVLAQNAGTISTYGMELNRTEEGVEGNARLSDIETSGTQVATTIFDNLLTGFSDLLEESEK